MAMVKAAMIEGKAITGKVLQGAIVVLSEHGPQASIHGWKPVEHHCLLTNDGAVDGWSAWSRGGSRTPA
jgi:hypothetical protein